MRYQTELATNVASLKAVGIEADTADARRGVRRRSPTLRAGIADARGGARPTSTPTALEAEADPRRRRRCCPAMAAVRAAADALEALVADDLWPLPDLPGDALHPLRSEAVDGGAGPVMAPPLVAKGGSRRVGHRLLHPPDARIRRSDRRFGSRPAGLAVPTATD